MSEGPSIDHLHLPNLTIKGFRGIDDLSISRLGRVTLLAGKNGVGKTTVLEACRVYAARGRLVVLSGLVRGHEEYSVVPDEDGDRMSALNLGALFHGRNPSINASIEIGPGKDLSRERLRIEITHPSREQVDLLESFGSGNLEDGDWQVLKTVFQDREYVVPWLLSRAEWGANMWERPHLYRRWQNFTNQEELPSAIACISLGPGLIQNDEVAAFWDSVALTDDESHAVEALQLVLGNTVERVAMVGDSGKRTRGHRRAVVKLSGHHRTVPLKSLGDGAIRLFGVALALATSRNGFLFIDEAENGIHYSVQPDFWHMVLKTAQENNVQVLATTHGWDCIRGFAQAATEINDIEGTLVRLEKENEGLRAIEYSESELETAAEQGIEVR